MKTRKESNIIEGSIKQTGTSVSFDIAKITPNARLDKWLVIQDLIDDYAKLHTDEVKDILDAAKEMRRGEHGGMSKKKTMQFGMLLPAGLMLLLKQHFSEVFRNKEQYAKFMRKFPGFKVLN